MTQTQTTLRIIVAAVCVGSAGSFPVGSPAASRKLDPKTDVRSSAAETLASPHAALEPSMSPEMQARLALVRETLLADAAAACAAIGDPLAAARALYADITDIPGDDEPDDLYG